MQRDYTTFTVKPTDHQVTRDMKMSMQKNENYFVFLSFKINLETDMCPTIHRIQSDESFHIPYDSHDLHQTSALFPFFKHNEF